MKTNWLLLCALVTLPSAAYAAGAIAVDDQAGDTDAGYGLAVGADTREEAAKQALQYCKEEGNTSCKVVVRFDKCGAYASSKDFYGVGWGNSKQAAIDMAKEKCGDHCKVIVSDCDSDE
jgi:hypothetical protein